MGDDIIVCIGNNNIICENVVIICVIFVGDEIVVGSGNFIMQGVCILYDVIIGNNCIIGNGLQVLGCCVVEDYVIFIFNVLMQGKICLGIYVVVQGGCCFIKDIFFYCVVVYEFMVFYSINIIVL